MKVFIHIGDARTGTSTLQTLATKNRDRLKQMSILYPEVGLLPKGSVVAHHGLSFSLMRDRPHIAEKSPDLPETAWGALAKYIADLSERDSVLFLSSEGFCTLANDGVKFISHFFKDHDVTPIFVRRDPEDWWRSMREHKIKTGRQIKDNDGPGVDLGQRKLDRWSKYFDVNCVPYGPECLKHVLSIMGIDIDALDPVERRNAQFPKELIGLLEALNKIPLAEDNRGRFKDVLAEQFPDQKAEIMSFLETVKLDGAKRFQFNEKIISLVART